MPIYTEFRITFSLQNSVNVLIPNVISLSFSFFLFFFSNEGWISLGILSIGSCFLVGSRLMNLVIDWNLLMGPALKSHHWVLFTKPTSIVFRYHTSDCLYFPTHSIIRMIIKTQAHNNSVLGSGPM